MTELVTYQRSSDKGAILTIDDGKANVVNPALLQALHQGLDQAQRDRVAVVLKGRPGVFSGGFDLRIARQSQAEFKRLVLDGGALTERLLSFPAPVVVASTGHAIAMGTFMVLAADLRLGLLGDYKYGMNEVAIGMILPHFAVAIAQARLAPTYMQRSVLLAEIYKPEQAQAAGYLDELLPDVEALDAMVAKQLEYIATLDFQAHAATKQRLRADALAALRQGITLDKAEFGI